MPDDELKHYKQPRPVFSQPVVPLRVGACADPSGHGYRIYVGFRFEDSDDCFGTDMSLDAAVSLRKKLDGVIAEIHRLQNSN